MKKLPSMQFYPGDWRKDPGVQALDYAHRGVWFEILLLMWESEERGKLMLNKTPMPTPALARILGLPEAEVKQILSTLVSYGVADIDEAGTLTNRRMVRDEEIRLAKVEAGRLGGLASRPPSKTEAEDKANGGSSVSVSSSASSVEAPKKRGKAKKAPLSESWSPTDSHREKASELRLDIAREVQRFRLHAEANGRKMVSWNAAFSSWLLKAHDFAAPQSNGTSTHRPNPQGFATPEELGL